MRLIDADAATDRYYAEYEKQEICDGSEDRNWLKKCIDDAPTIEAEPVWVVHRKNGIYDVYKGNRNNWVIARLSADNVFSWLAEQNLVDIRFVDESIPAQLRMQDGRRC